MTRNVCLLAAAALTLGCDNTRNDPGVVSEVERVKGELRRLSEVANAPLNDCRTRIKGELQRIGRGPAATSLAAPTSVLCLRSSTIADCTDISNRLPDACGWTDLHRISEPRNAGDNKRFIDEVAASRTRYEATVARAAIAKATARYREDCTWVGDDGITYEDRGTGVTKRVATARCDVELTSIDATGAPTATITATATVKPNYEATLEKAASEIDATNKRTLEAATKQARDALFAQLN